MLGAGRIRRLNSLTSLPYLATYSDNENSFGLPPFGSTLSYAALGLLTRFRISLGGILFACAAPLSGIAVHASEPVAIDEIQVTATRRATSTASISTGVSVVREQRFELESLVTDAVAGQIGTFVQETTPGQGAIIIRGMKGSEVLHLVDSVRLNNAIFRNAPTQYVALVDPRIVERAEIVRGSVSSLYGSDAMGGAANFITHKPQITTSGKSFRSDLYMFGSTADLAKGISIGIEASNETLAGLARISSFDSGNRRTGSGERTPFTAYGYDAARLALSAAPSEGQSWLIDLQYLQQPEIFRVDELVPGYGQTVPESSEFSFKPNERAFAHVSYQALRGWGTADWKVDLGWQRIVDDRTIRGYESRVRKLERNSSDLISINVEAIKQVANNTWVFGLTKQHDTVRSFRDEMNIVSGAETSVASRFPDDATIGQSAAYARLQRPIGARSEFSLGVRFSAVDIDVPDTLVTEASSINITDLTGDIGWTYSITDSWSLVANLGRGFRAPNIFDLGTFGERPGNRFNIPNEQLAAETVLHADAGIRHLGSTWSGELRIYSLQYKDKIESIATGDVTPDGRQVTQSQNLASVDVKGTEFSSQVLLTDNLELGAVVNFAWGESRLVTEAATPADRIPPINGRIELDWRINERWRISPNLLFAAKQDRLSPRDENDPRIDPNGTSGWITVNAILNYSTNERISLNFAVHNIFDQQYRVHGSGIDARGIDLSASATLRWD
jgi:hemoglobin/transferrin/lactoferrin receptor protein